MINFQPQTTDLVEFHMGQGEPSAYTMQCVNYAYDWMVAKSGFKTTEQHTVIVHVDPRHIDQHHGAEVNGFCCQDEEDKTEIHIVLREDVNCFQSSMVAAHEAVHAFQFATGLLATVSEGQHYWMGELEQGLDYYQMGAEKQAHRYQSMIAMDFHSEVVASD